MLPPAAGRPAGARRPRATPGRGTAESTSSASGWVRSCSASGRRATRSRLRWRMSAGSRLVPTQRAQAAGRLGRLPEACGPAPRPAARSPARLRSAEQPEVGVGRVRQPVEQQRQHLLHQPRRAGEAPGQLVDGGLGALAVGEPEGAQAGLDGAGLGQQVAVGGGERLEQRPEVEPLVDRAHRPPGAGRSAASSCSSGRRRSGVAVAASCGRGGASTRRRSGMAYTWAPSSSCSTCSSAAQEPVRLGQLLGVVAVDVAGTPPARRAPSRVVGDAQLGVEAAVHELQELHGELDVADAAPPALHLPVGEALAGQLGLDAGLQAAQRAQVVGAEGAAPEVLAGAASKAGAELGGRRRRPAP